MRGALTIAFGKKKYIDMGAALGRSLKRHCPHLTIAVVTDDVSGVLADIFDHIIPLNTEYGKDVAQKLYVDVYSPFEQTLFIDSDSLVFGNLDYVFEGMQGGQTIIPDPLYFHDRGFPKKGIDFDAYEAKTGFDSIPGFNGGVYYIERGTPSEATFVRGREIMAQHADYGIGLFRTTPPDEIVLAVSMAIYGYQEHHPLPKHVMRETFGQDGPIQLDSITGTAKLICYGKAYEPSVVHFCSGWRDQLAYEMEMKKLAVLSKGGPASVALAKTLTRVYPTWCSLKDKFAKTGCYLWGVTPRPIRLTWHAVKNRIGRTSANTSAN